MKANFFENIFVMHLWFTYGPSIDDPELIRQALIAGANGCRLTFSFGTAELQLERALLVKKIARELDVDCRIIADVAGEKVRLSDFSPPRIEIMAGETITLGVYGTPTYPEKRFFSITSNSLFQYAKPDDLLVIGDGALTLKVCYVSDDTIETISMNGGILNPNRGIILQNPLYSPECLTGKDEKDLRFIAQSNLQNMVFDYVALSFVSHEENIIKTRKIFYESGKNIPIIAKIESPLGLRNVDSIAQAADYLLAARGDLAITMNWLELPNAMKSIQEAAVKTKTPWLLATQIVEGFERFGMPTRAEICDLHTWTRAGISGVLLSYETAFGRAPIKAIQAVSEMLARWG